MTDHFYNFVYFLKFLFFIFWSGQTGRITDTTGTGGEKTEEQAAKVTTTLKGSMGERITKALNKVEEKKKKRAARKAQVCIEPALMTTSI